MNGKIQKCIEQIYVNKDFNYFKRSCKKEYKFIEELQLLANTVCSKLYLESAIHSPTVDIRFVFEDYEQDIYFVHYQTILKISKLADMFYLQHEFCVENKDPNRMTPVLDGFGGEPYTKTQYKMEEQITRILEKNKMEKIEFNELDEVVGSLEMLPNSILGKQMTVELALFHDAYGIND